ncbi:hypothetical protein Efla_001176 [Eimeria flavescens]
MEGSVTRLRAAYEAAGQGHVFAFYERLSDSEKQTLQREAEKYDPLGLNKLLEGALHARREADLQEDHIRPPHKVDLSHLSALLSQGAQRGLEDPGVPQAEEEADQQQQRQQAQQRLENAYRAALPTSSACAVVSLDEAPLSLRQLWRDTGLQLIAEGRVGVVLLAGGDGSRLGFSGVKGAFPVGPLSRCSLFSLFASRIRRLLVLAAAAAASKHSSSTSSSSIKKPRVPLYVMTSEANRAVTEEAFGASGFFGLERSDVFFFSQGATPTFDLQGRLMLKTPCQLRRAPDGNGGLFPALLADGALKDMRERGLLGVQVFAVDNALAKAADPTFYGFAATSGALVANKVIRRRSPQESVGLMCEVLTRATHLTGSQQQQPQQQEGARWAGAVVEYSEVPEQLLEAASPKGGTSESPYAWGNVCMHYFDLRFLEAVVARADVLRSRYHLAKKRIPQLRLVRQQPPQKAPQGAPPGAPAEACVDESDPASWEAVAPEEPNGWKLELFIFDVFPLADQVLCLEVDRDEEFAPIKCSSPSKGRSDTAQAKGELVLSSVAPDTPESAQLMMSYLHAKWLEAATGKQLPHRSPHANKHVFCEVSPLRSYEGEGLEESCLNGMDLSGPILIE